MRDNHIDTGGAGAVARLTAEFGRERAVRFGAGPNGSITAELSARGARASVALQGAQVLSYVPAGGCDVLWVSPDARFGPGTSVRGGIPICWPWFGQHASDATKPAHGFVRSAPWRVIASAHDEVTARISLAFATTPDHAQLWPHQARVRLDVTLGDALRLDLITDNTSQVSLPLTQALHSYFAISDVADVVIQGLEGTSYMDHAGERTRRTQSGPILLDREVDRVFDRSPETVVIDNRALDRRIKIAKAGSHSTVVWNPWIAKSARLGDMGPDGYRRMVCIETANAGEDIVRLAPGATHRLSTIISSERL